MRDVADVVAADVQGEKELNDNRSGDEQLHRNRNGERKKPYLTIRKHDSRGNQDAVNCAGGADRGNGEGKPCAARIKNRLDEHVDAAGADARYKIILIEALC